MATIGDGRKLARQSSSTMLPRCHDSLFSFEILEWMDLLRQIAYIELLCTLGCSCNGMHNFSGVCYYNIGRDSHA